MRILGKGYPLAPLLLALFGFAVIYATSRVPEKHEVVRSAGVADMPQPSAFHSYKRLLAAPINAAQIGGNFEVKQAVIAAGGGRSSGGTFQVEDTLGQSLVGQSSGGSFSVSDGFWSDAAAVQPSAPVISGLSPASVTAGGAAFPLTVNGSNFVNGSVVRWNGSDRQTTFVGTAQLTAQIPASDIATAGSAQVTVFNPPPGGGSSNAVSLTITPVVASFTISGRITYADIGLISVPGAVVTASALGATVSSPPSSSDGRYAIQGVGRGTYRLQAAKSGNVNSVTAFDAARILRQRINNEPFLGLQRRAADVDGNEVVDERDALLIANFVTGKSVVAQAGMWYLEAVNNSTVDVSGNLPDQNFRSALIGDVSGNWLPGVSLAITAVTPVTLRFENSATGGAVSLPCVRISGSGFAPGMKLIATFPGGGEMKLSGAQMIALSPESFTVALPVIERGLWAFRAVNAEGKISDAFVVKVE